MAAFSISCILEKSNPISQASSLLKIITSGELTASGKPLLANDPHLAYTQPPRWFEIHLKGGRFNTSGVCIAGIPIPVIGQNQHVAWGFTNSMVDDVDFFIEKTHPDDSTKYLWGDQWRQIEFQKEILMQWQFFANCLVVIISFEFVPCTFQDKSEICFDPEI